MIRWIPYTFIRIVLFFVAGIALGIYLPEIISLATAQYLLLFLAGTYFIFYFFFRIRKEAFFNLGFIGLPVIFLAGYVHLLMQTGSSQPDHFIASPKQVQFYQAVITKYPEKKQRSWKAEATVLKIFTDEWQQKQGKVVLYFSQDDFKAPFQYGDVLLIKDSPQIVPPPSNPGEFDYKRFLAFKNIYHQHFLRSGDVMLLANDPPNTLMYYAIRARLWADATLKKFVDGEREQAIASALVLGVVDGLDNELLTAYAATGAMHVLAVSGLHISIIYMILIWLLKPLQRLRSGPWLLALISLFVLWGYAFVTGLSPSVLRAVTMFSFIAVARPAGQSTNIYNTLAASAFCLLLFDPFLIMSVGFQLSYLAVLGIVYLQPGLYRLWEPQNRLWDEVWKITCVSIAAQVATFSLGLLYFHQFPNYFLLSNLLVIPGSFMVLIFGLVVLAISFLQPVASLIGWMLTWSIKILNFVVFTIEAFPFSLVENIHIGILQCWLLAALAVVVILLIQYKKFYYGSIAFALIVIFSIAQWNHFRERIDVQKITIYNVRGHSAIDLIDRGHAYFLTDSVLLKDVRKVQFHVHPNRLEAGISLVTTERVQPFVKEFRGIKMIRWRGKMVAHVMQKDFTFPEDLAPDLVVISNNAVRDISQLPSSGRSKIILDSSNSYFYTQKILTQAKETGVAVHSVMHDGAFDLVIRDGDT